MWSSLYLSVCLSACLPIYGRAGVASLREVGMGGQEGGREEAAPTKSHEVTQG